jgi:hypothetical protein
MGILVNWLLLRSGIVKSVPCTATIFRSIVLPHPSSNHSLFIHQCSLAAAETHIAKHGLGEKCP